MPRKNKPSQKKRLKKHRDENLSATALAERAAVSAEHVARCALRVARRAKQEEDKRMKDALHAREIAASRATGYPDPQFKKKNRNKSAKRARVCEASDSSAPLEDASGRHSRPSSLVLISSDELLFGSAVGEGASATVFLATWNGRQVAVKQLARQGFSDAALFEFQTELSVVSRLIHPNICRLWGACLLPLRIVMEFAEHGSLWDVLHTRALDDGQRNTMALEIASAMEYLHSFQPPLLHRDLKSANILVNADYATKLADFGLSRTVSSNAPMTGCVGTVNWMAPEVISRGYYDEKTDVYSFSIVLWELFTAECPYGLAVPLEVAAKVSQGYRPSIASSMPVQFCQLMKACWA